MERVDRPTVAAFYAPEPYIAGGMVTLGEEAAHHMRVRRLEVGERVELRDGAGRAAAGVLRRIAKGSAAVEVETVSEHAPPPPVHLLVPIGDRDRMLWLAEKCTELAATSWRPVLWRRSRSVTPRGEGTAFQGKVHGRMTSALVQSEGGWLPALYPDAPVERAIAAAPVGTRLLLDPDGVPMLDVALTAPVSIALGPEGGVERDERAQLVSAGFVPVALAGNVLRFETAGVAALAIARAALALAPVDLHEDQSDGR